MLDRLLNIEVSALCDADKTLPVVDRAIHPMVPDVRMAGPAFTVTADRDLLPVLSALAEAAPGDVLVIATNGTETAVLGEIFTTEAHRRGLAGIVIDGWCRDVAGIRAIGLPLYARGPYPAAVPGVDRTPSGRTVRCGGIDVAPGDIVFGDDDGVVIAPGHRIEAALPAAEEIIRKEREILRRVRGGEALHSLTNFDEHAARLDAGKESRLSFEVDG